MSLKLIKFKKISWKLTITYSLIFSLVLILLNTAILYGVKIFLIKQSINQVENSSYIVAQTIIGTPQEQTELTDPELLSESQLNSEINIKVANSQGKVVNSSNNFNTEMLDITSDTGIIRQIKIQDRHLILKNSKVMVGNKIKAYFQVSKNMKREYSFIELLFIFMAIADLLGIIISVFVGYLISKKILKPIDSITKTAKSISVTDLNSKIEVEDTDDELTRLAITFNEMIERLRVSFEKQNRFVSDASHELRTPISVIQGYINLIDRWGKDDKNVLQESINAIKNETSDMVDLVERLLFLARGDISTLKLHKENIKLSQLVEEVIKESRFIAPEHNLSFKVDEKVQLNADRKMIKQMLRALVDNSIKFTSKGGEISINAEAVLNQVKITVADNGIGISLDEIEKIFDRFYRVDKARAKDTGGSGLGLSIVKWIVDAHNGSVSAESIVGKGTSILIMLPCN